MQFVFNSLILLCFMAISGHAEDALNKPEENPPAEQTGNTSSKSTENSQVGQADNATSTSEGSSPADQVGEKKTKVAAKTAIKPLPEMSLGCSSAPIVIINYSSLTCGHCAQFHESVLPEIQKKYIDPGFVRIIFRDYPGDQISLRAHQLAWCKGELKYLDFVKLLYSTQDKWLQADDPIVALKSIALQNGVTAEQFEACIKDQELMDKIIQLRLEGQKKYNITSTPTIIINAKIYPRSLSFEEFEEIVRPLLAPTVEKKE